MFYNLNAEMARNKKSQVDIARVLNISVSTLSEKMNGKRDFKLKECKEIIKNVLPGYTIDYLFETNSQQNNSSNDS